MTIGGIENSGGKFVDKILETGVRLGNKIKNVKWLGNAVTAITDKIRSTKALTSINNKYELTDKGVVLTLKKEIRTFAQNDLDTFSKIASNVKLWSVASHLEMLDKLNLDDLEKLAAAIKSPAKTSSSSAPFDGASKKVPDQSQPLSVSDSSNSNTPPVSSSPDKYNPTHFGGAVGPSSKFGTNGSEGIRNEATSQDITKDRGLLRQEIETAVSNLSKNAKKVFNILAKEKGLGENASNRFSNRTYTVENVTFETLEMVSGMLKLMENFPESKLDQILYIHSLARNNPTPMEQLLRESKFLGY